MSIEKFKSPTDQTNPAEVPDRDALLERCRDLANADNVLFEFKTSLQRHGFIGSTRIPEILYLATFTRMFERPVSAAIKGPSSYGKSFALETTLRYVPDHAYKKLQGISDKGLAYSTDLDLQHKCLIIGEASGLADGNGRSLLRQFLTENEIRYRTVERSKRGLTAKELHIKGPVSLLLTTTDNSLYWEDETRMLSLHVDQSPDEIRRRLMAIPDGEPTRPSPEELSKWHAFHDFVCSGDLKVEIPYRTALLRRIPANQGRVLRDAPKLLGLIRAHTLLHQRRRKRNGDGVLIADLYDYYMVHPLIEDVLAYGLQASVPTHIRQVVEAVANSRSSPMSLTEVSDILQRDLGVVSKNVNAAIKDGYLENRNPGQGRRAELVLGQRRLREGTVLPDPSEFIEEFGGEPDASEEEVPDGCPEDVVHDPECPPISPEPNRLDNLETHDAPVGRVRKPERQSTILRS